MPARGDSTLSGFGHNPSGRRWVQVSSNRARSRQAGSAARFSSPRSRMLEVWYALPARSEAASWWVAQAAAGHYLETDSHGKYGVHALFTEVSRRVLNAAR